MFELYSIIFQMKSSKIVLYSLIVLVFVLIFVAITASIFSIFQHLYQLTTFDALAHLFFILVLILVVPLLIAIFCFLRRANVSKAIENLANQDGLIESDNLQDLIAMEEGRFGMFFNEF